MFRLAFANKCPYFPARPLALPTLRRPWEDFSPFRPTMLGAGVECFTESKMGNLPLFEKIVLVNLPHKYLVHQS